MSPKLTNARLAAIHADLAALKADCHAMPFDVSIALTRAMVAVEAADTELREHMAGDVR